MSVKHHFAFTAPINPSGVTPVLTRDQVWRGLLKKGREPQAFVPVIAECEVLEEDEHGMRRVVKFKEGMTPVAKVTEVLTYFPQMKVDFHALETNMDVSNVISSGAGGEHDLYLTFTFDWNYPNVEAGTAEADQKIKQSEKLAGQAVPHSVAQIRKLVVEGQI